MSIKKTLLVIIFSFIFSTANAEEDLKSLGKFKDWQSFVLLNEGVKVCFAQSIPVVRAPKKFKRNIQIHVHKKNFIYNFISFSF